MADELKMVEESSEMLWSVRANGEVFLIVRNKMTDWSGFDVHAVTEGGVEYLGDAPSHDEALKLIQAEINGG